MQWVIVGVAVGVLPTYVLMSERVKKESDAASATAASAAAASVYAAWNAAPKPVCSVQPMTMPTVEAVTQTGSGAPRHARAAPANHAAGGGKEEGEGDDNGAQMLMQMMPMMQGMMNDNGSGAPAGSGMPDMSELMKNMPKK
ncbi:MAG TPA: hypothetical protein VGH87_13030 [Polyangiaceae bacterium]